MVALELLLTVAVVTLKLAVVAAAVTVTEAGVLRTALLSDRVTLAPPLGAGWVRVAVQVLEEFEPMFVGLHVRDDTNTGATRLTLVLAELLL
jgi:hypothetical protein